MDSYWGQMDPLAPIRLLMFSNVHFSLWASLSGIKLISKIKILHIQFSVTQIRPQPSPLFNIHNLFGVKLLTRLRLGLSHLNEHKFNHNLNGCINPFSTCTLEPESTSHFFLHCHDYNSMWLVLFKDLNSADKNLIKRSDED